MISSKPLAFSSSTSFELLDDGDSRSKSRISGKSVIFVTRNSKQLLRSSLYSGSTISIAHRKGDVLRIVEGYKRLSRVSRKVISTAPIHAEVYELASLGDSLGGYTIEGSSREELAQSLRRALKGISG